MKISKKTLIISAALLLTLLGSSTIIAGHTIRSKDPLESNNPPTPKPQFAQSIVEEKRPENNAENVTGENSTYIPVDIDNPVPTGLGNIYVQDSSTNNPLKTAPPTPQSNTEDLRDCVGEPEHCQPPVVLGIHDEVPPVKPTLVVTPAPTPVPTELPEPTLIPVPLPDPCTKGDCIPPYDPCAPCPPGMLCPMIVSPCMY